MIPTRKEKVKEHRILEGLIKGETFPDFTALRQVMRKEIKYDQQSGKHDNIEQQRLREIHDSRIRDLNNIIKSWIYYAHTEYQPTLNTARLLVPDNIQGAVVLDATASSMLFMNCSNFQKLSLLLLDHVTTRM